jgi:hypothetical protein
MTRHLKRSADDSEQEQRACDVNRDVRDAVANQVYATEGIVERK